MAATLSNRTAPVSPVLWHVAASCLALPQPTSPANKRPRPLQPARKTQPPPPKQSPPPRRHTTRRRSSPPSRPRSPQRDPPATPPPRSLSTTLSVPPGAAIPAPRPAILTLLRDLRKLQRARRPIARSELHPLLCTLSAQQVMLHNEATRLCVLHASLRRGLRLCGRGCRAAIVAARAEEARGRAMCRDCDRAEAVMTTGVAAPDGAAELWERVCPGCDSRMRCLEEVRREANALGRRSVVVARAEVLMREVQSRSVGPEWMETLRVTLLSLGKL